MSRALASIGMGPHESLLRLSRRSLAPYAERHGYELHALTDAPTGGRPPAWAKVILLRRLVQEYETVVWIDADAMIVDGTEDIARELPSDRLMALHTHDTAAGSMPNAGVWVLRGGDEAVSLLDEMWSQVDLIDHRWWENAALCRLLGYRLDPVGLDSPTPLLLMRTADLPKIWNSIPDDPARNPRIRHYPGYSIRTRRLLMRRDLVATRLRGARRRTGDGAR